MWHKGAVQHPSYVKSAWNLHYLYKYFTSHLPHAYICFIFNGTSLEASAWASRELQDTCAPLVARLYQTNLHELENPKIHSTWARVTKASFSLINLSFDTKIKMKVSCLQLSLPCCRGISESLTEATLPFVKLKCKKHQSKTSVSHRKMFH